jgi:two-component system response regulator AtoC
VAEGGTLFIDEVAEMSPGMQAKLLRVLEDGHYRKVGGTGESHADVRVIAATNKPLEAEQKAGRFREDLYYRLNVIPLHIPPLRERRDDIAALVMHFFRRMREDLGREDLDGFSVEALTLLETYSWPGNIRELQNVVERTVLLAIGPEVSAQDLPMTVRARDVRNGGPAGLPAELPAMGLDLKAVVDEYESNLIRQALARTGGNKNRAAQLLGLNRTTLVEMVKRKRIAS